ncbi:MAG: PD-(D/E)XK nuclease domain-containing protein, partial [Bacteroidales bacterium]|nr:PD-(D/E)XK nuclease domain-containing protein [Bacteroidales bacterium]
AARRREYISYWTSTSAYDSISTYIQMNFDGLKDDIINMLAGGRCHVNTTGFTNDLKMIRSKDDVLTVLIHLGYLSYDLEEEDCHIPNKEVRLELEQAIKLSSWDGITKTIEQSRSLLEATLRGDADAVAKYIDQAHDENTSILSYNNENSLSCVISIAYIFARNNYVMHREYATGRGFADIVMIPHRNFNSPAIVVELKYNKTAGTAIEQIKQKNYPAKLAEYSGEIMLVGISYDRENKTHECVIETV